MTFSIVAVDRRQSEAGLAIASCCWDAGQVCMAWHDLGAMASQASGNLSLLGHFRDRLTQKADLDTILEHFRAVDERIETRQIGMVSIAGGALAFTGAECSPWAGHRTGADYSCQGNILAGPEVVDSMTDAFETTSGPLYRRLYAALAAGDAAGGDLRGRQSARLAVKKAERGQPGTHTLLDISIKDHENPVNELGRILGVGEELMDILGRVDAFSRASDAEKPGVLRELRGFLDDKRHCRYLDWWETLATSSCEIGDLEGAVDAYRVYLQINPALAGVVRRSAEAGAIPRKVVDRLFGDEGPPGE